MRSRFGLKSRLSNMALNRNCRYFAPNPNLRPTSIVKSDKSAKHKAAQSAALRCNAMSTSQKLHQITFSARIEIAFAFAWDFYEVLNLPEIFDAICQTVPKFQIYTSFGSVYSSFSLVYHVNRYRRGTSK